jgi:uncharacterized membrane protein
MDTSVAQNVIFTFIKLVILLMLIGYPQKILYHNFLVRKKALDIISRTFLSISILFNYMIY